MSQKRTEEAPLLLLVFSITTEKQQRGVCLSSQAGSCGILSSWPGEPNIMEGGSEDAFTKEEANETTPTVNV